MIIFAWLKSFNSIDWHTRFLSSNHLASYLKSLVLSHRFWLLLAILAFVLQAGYNLTHVRTWFDEGNYAYKGYIAANGIYPMYKDGGPYFEYMPLAFLVPGVIQAVFGPDFIAGRLFSILCGTLAIVVTYLVGKRLASRRAGLISAWFVVGNLIILRYYTTISPYSWVSLFLMLSLLVLTSSMASPYRELGAVFFAAITFVTRQNMVVALGIIVLYGMIVQKRVSSMIIVALSAFVFPALFIAPYWPDLINETLAPIPLVGKFFAAFLEQPKLATKGSLYPWSFKDFLEGMDWLINFHFPILFASFFTLFQSTKAWFRAGASLAFLWNNRLCMLAGLLFFSNFIVHTVGPQHYCAQCPAVYFNYFAPVGALVGGIGIASMLRDNPSRLQRNLVIGIVIFSTLIISTVTKARTFTIHKPRFQMIQNAAERLASLTRPEDKIFAIADMHVFLLAKRYPYPALMTHEYNFVITEDPINALKKNRWNYALAKQWLSEADVIVLSHERFTALPRLYPGYPGSGQDLKDLIEKLVAEDFPVMVTIPCSHGDEIELYRRVPLK